MNGLTEVGGRCLSPGSETCPPLERLAWYVVYSKPHKEGFAALQLRRRGIDVFWPQLLLPTYAQRDRCRSLFPNYLFVKIRLRARFHDVLWTPGVTRFVSANGVPASLDESVVALLREHSDPEGRIQARPSLKVGQDVEVAEGPLTGLRGIIESPPDAQGRVKILMELLNQRAVRVKVPARLVRISWIA
jgi:transcriptional antiterminator RfaH